MKKEQLIALGLTEEAANNVLKLFKESIDGEYIPKHRFDEVNGELKTVKGQVSERDEQIKGLKKFEGDAAALKTKLDELETANKTQDAAYKTQLALERKKNAIKLALLDDKAGKPFDTDMVMGLFNLDNIIVDEQTGKIVSGYKEQNETLRKDKTFLFDKVEGANPPPVPGITVKGKTPPDGDPGNTGNASEAYGKSLAAIKLGMMGVTAEPTQPPKQ